MPSCLACRPCAVLFSFLLPPSAPPPSPGSLSAPARHESCACSRLLREARARQSRIHVCYAHSQHIYAMRQNNVFFTILGSHQLMLPACSRCFTRAPVTCCWRAHHACTQCAHAKSCDNLTGLRAQGADSHLRAALPAGPAASGAAFKLGTQHGTRHGASWWQVQHAGAWRTWRERERERERSHSPGITLAFVKNEVNKREKKRRHLSRVITPLAMG